MYQVAIVFIANELEQVGIQDPTNFFGHGPWFSIGLRVIDRDVEATPVLLCAILL
jgi:hypothetical protein